MSRRDYYIAEMVIIFVVMMIMNTALAGALMVMLIAIFSICHYVGASYVLRGRMVKNRFLVIINRLKNIAFVILLLGTTVAVPKAFSQYAVILYLTAIQVYATCYGFMFAIDRINRASQKSDAGLRAGKTKEVGYSTSCFI